MGQLLSSSSPARQADPVADGTGTTVTRT